VVRKGLLDDDGECIVDLPVDACGPLAEGLLRLGPWGPLRLSVGEQVVLQIRAVQIKDIEEDKGTDR
jgi:hypothetical protein